jgi:molecular chaperone HtpG
MSKADPTQYIELWREFGRAIKEGIASDRTNRDRILPLLLFASSNSDSALTTLEDYVVRMKPKQADIIYLSGENRALLERSPHLEATLEKEHEVLFLTDPVDELMLQHLTDVHDKPLKSAAKDVFKANDSQEDRNILRAEEEKYVTVLKFLKDTLQPHVKRVQLSTRLTKSPACLVVDAYDNSPWMDQMLLRGKGGGLASKRILELNPKHPIIVTMNRRLMEGTEDPVLAQSAHVLFNIALIAEGSDISDPVTFSETVTQLLERFID